jgi:hypothetical protein
LAAPHLSTKERLSKISATFIHSLFHLSAAGPLGPMSHFTYDDMVSTEEEVGYGLGDGAALTEGRRGEVESMKVRVEPDVASTQLGEISAKKCHKLYYGQTSRFRRQS